MRLEAFFDPGVGRLGLAGHARAVGCAARWLKKRTAASIAFNHTSATALALCACPSSQAAVPRPALRATARAHQRRRVR